jgi:hypothetical protein
LTQFWLVLTSLLAIGGQVRGPSMNKNPVKMGTPLCQLLVKTLQTHFFFLSWVDQISWVYRFWVRGASVSQPLQPAWVRKWGWGGVGVASTLAAHRTLQFSSLLCYLHRCCSRKRTKAESQCLSRDCGLCFK